MLPKVNLQIKDALLGRRAKENSFLLQRISSGRQAHEKEKINKLRQEAKMFQTKRNTMELPPRIITAADVNLVSQV